MNSGYIIVLFNPTTKHCSATFTEHFEVAQEALEGNEFEDDIGIQAHVVDLSPDDRDEGR